MYDHIALFPEKKGIKTVMAPNCGHTNIPDSELKWWKQSEKKKK